LKWSIYDWIGAISVEELVGNLKLKSHIESLFRILTAIDRSEVK
jgi:hypothetical protein